MPIKTEDFKVWEDANQDSGYSQCCVDVARKVMEYMDEDSDPIDASELVHRANRELDSGITGFMAGAVAQMVSTCHTRGEEFRKSWNKSQQVGTEGEDTEGVINPALVTIDVEPPPTI